MSRNHYFDDATRLQYNSEKDYWHYESNAGWSVMMTTDGAREVALYGRIMQQWLPTLQQIEEHVVCEHGARADELLDEGFNWSINDYFNHPGDESGMDVLWMFSGFHEDYKFCIAAGGYRGCFWWGNDGPTLFGVVRALETPKVFPRGVGVLTP